MNILTGKKASKVRILISLFKKYKKSAKKGVLIKDGNLYHLLHNNTALVFEIKKKVIDKAIKKADETKWSYSVQNRLPKEKLITLIRRTKPFEYKINGRQEIRVNG